LIQVSGQLLVIEIRADDLGTTAAREREHQREDESTHHEDLVPDETYNTATPRRRW
jgi:hypothetical protein